MMAKRSTRIWMAVVFVATSIALVSSSACSQGQEVEPRKVGAVGVQEAQKEVLSLKQALEIYREHTGTFPATEQGLEALLSPPKDVVASWNGPYLQALPIDPWEAPYQYEFVAETSQTSAGFTLYSFGADSAPGGQGFNADIGIASAEPVMPEVFPPPPPPVLPVPPVDAPFHIETVPTHALVRIMNIEPAYRDGMELPPAEYRVQVSAAGFDTKEEIVPHGASATTHRIVLNRTPPKEAPFFVETVPPNARVTVVEGDGSVAWSSGQMRHPGVQLPPGDYLVEVRADGYDAKERMVSHGTSATTHRIVLNRTPPPEAPLFVETVPSNALVQVVSSDGSIVWNSTQMRRPGVQLPPGNYRVQASAEGFEEKAEVVSHGESAVTMRMALQPVVPPAPRLPAVQEPRLVERIEPEYPSAAIRRDVEGRVVLEFTISHTGRVQDIVVVESTPAGAFDRAATDALTQWRYTPRTEDGQPVEVRGAQTQFVFQLDD